MSRRMDVKARARSEAGTYADEPLTAKQDVPSRCANPLCHHFVNLKHGKRFCSDPCKLRGYVLRQAKAMVDEIGIVEFTAILKSAT